MGGGKRFSLESFPPSGVGTMRVIGINWPLLSASQSEKCPCKKDVSTLSTISTVGCVKVGTGTGSLNGNGSGRRRRKKKKIGFRRGRSEGRGWHIPRQSQFYLVAKPKHHPITKKPLNLFANKKTRLTNTIYRNGLKGGPYIARNFRRQTKHLCTEMEEYLGNEEVRAAQPAGAKTRCSAIKKREISCTSLPINIHFWVHTMKLK